MAPESNNLFSEFCRQWQERNGKLLNHFPSEQPELFQHTFCTPGAVRPHETRDQTVELADAGSVTLCRHCAGLPVAEVGWHNSGAYGDYRDQSIQGTRGVLRITTVG
jgi:hypothetical protein